MPRIPMPKRLAVAGSLFAVFAASAAGLPAPVLERLHDAGLPADAMAVVVQRLSDGALRVSHRADASMQPASTMKLVTSMVALESLGPAYRGRTELRVAGTVSGEVLRGDVVLRGLADVDLDWPSLQRMLQQLRLRGVREIRGDLLLDFTLFRPARTDIGAAPFDESPEFRYNVIPDALSLNSNLVQLELASDSERTRVAMSPSLDNVSVVSDMKVVERACEDWEDGWIHPEYREHVNGAVQIRLLGEFPRDCAATTAVNVLDRVLFADRLFRAAWMGLGGTITGRTREAQTPAGAALFAEHRSRPLAEVTRDINKRSDNPTTRIVYLAMGALADCAACDSTARRAEQEVRAWFARRGIVDDGMVLDNGSGLSRVERIRPTQLAAVLKAASLSPWAPEFFASLPIVAVDGGMTRRLRESPAAGRARLKTGTLRNVSAVAGYVEDAAGESHIVVAMINHELATRQVARPILDALVDWVARSRTAGPLAAAKD
jgi:serine-type D-Ala-D-Ala carboxypeptidase/endopeptidase (penicillin-binding protein 4)